MTLTKPTCWRWPMWLKRHDNLPLGCLARHLWRILK